MLSSLASARATAATVDCLLLPFQPASRNPVVFCHGHGTDAGQAVGAASSPAVQTVMRAITDGPGFPCAANSQGNNWGNSTARSRVTDAVTLLRTSAGGAHASKKVVLVGVSMGGASVLSWANTNPTLVDRIVLILPAIDLEALRTADTLSTRSSIDAAYGVTYPAALPAGTNPAGMASALSAIPIDLWYSSDDSVSANHSTFASTHGNTTEHNLGALGHTNAAIAAVSTSSVASFVGAAA